MRGQGAGRCNKVTSEIYRRHNSHRNAKEALYNVRHYREKCAANSLGLTNCSTMQLAHRKKFMCIVHSAKFGLGRGRPEQVFTVSAETEIVGLIAL